MRAALSTLALSSAAHASLPLPATVIAAMDSAAQYYQRMHPTPGDCGWTQGTLYAGAMAHYDVTLNATLANIAKDWATTQNWVCNLAVTDCNSYACGMA